jgi:hypothetical protein
LTITSELKELEPEKSQQIKAVFDPMVEMLQSFEEAYNQVVAMDPGEETSKIAKRLRLDIGKIRINADKEHKRLKEESLRTGRAIDGIRNILKFAITDKEEKLKEIETHFERIEAERIRVLQESRQDELYKYNPDHPFIDLGNMSEEVWINFLAGTKASYEARIEAERKAEEERLAAEEAEKAKTYRMNKMYELGLKYDGQSFVFRDINFHWTDLICMKDDEFEKAWSGASKRKQQIEKEIEAEQEQIRKENEKLQKEAEKREKALLKEREAVAAREEKARLVAEEKLRFRDESIRKEREAREKLEAEAEQKRQEEAERVRAEEARKAQEESDRREAERKAANAPDKEKLETIAQNLLNKVDMFSSEESKRAMITASRVLSNAAENL